MNCFLSSNQTVSIITGCKVQDVKGIKVAFIFFPFLTAIVSSSHRNVVWIAMYWVAQQLDLMDSRAGLVSYLIWSAVTYILLKIHMVHTHTHTHTHTYIAGLKLNIQKTKIMAFSPITLWQIDEDTMETVTDFIFLGSKIIADGDCSHEIKRCSLLGRKAMTNLDGVLKCRDVTLPTKVHIVKAVIFPVVMYGCESCTIKKTEC